MRILFVALWPIETNNSVAIQNAALIKGLDSGENLIHILTIAPTENQVINKKYYESENISLYFAKANHLHDRILKTSKNKSAASIKQILIGRFRKIYHYFNLFDYTYQIAKNISPDCLGWQDYDLIISSSDPKTSHIAVQNLINKGLHYKVWIQYWGDPLVNDISKHTIYPKIYMKKVEYNILKNSDKIVYVSPFTLQEQQKEYTLLKEKMVFEPLPYYQEKIYDFCLENISEKNVIIGYFGAYMSKVRNIMPLYQTCKKDKLKLLIAGDTDVKLESDKSISIWGRLPNDEIERLEESAHILVCILNKYGTQIPGKLYYMAGTNKPILVIVDGEHKKQLLKYIRQFDRFYTCYNNSDDIRNAIKKILADKKKFKPVEQFKAEHIVNRILSYINLADKA